MKAPAGRRGLFGLGVTITYRDDRIVPIGDCDVREQMDSVSIAFELMALELNTAIENLNSEGARNFKSSNYEEARRLTERGLALNDFCGRVECLAAEWVKTYAGQPDASSDAAEATETARKILSASKAPKSGLLVRFHDGTVICEPKAADTLVKVIEKIGFDRVEALGLVVNHENIVSRQKSPKYQDTYVPPFYVKTHSSTDQKKKNLERISEQLGLGLQVIIID